MVLRLSLNRSMSFWRHFVGLPFYFIIARLLVSYSHSSVMPCPIDFSAEVLAEADVAFHRQWRCEWHGPLIWPGSGLSDALERSHEHLRDPTCFIASGMPSASGDLLVFSARIHTTSMITQAAVYSLRHPSCSTDVWVQLVFVEIYAELRPAYHCPLCFCPCPLRVLLLGSASSLCMYSTRQTPNCRCSSRSLDFCIINPLLLGFPRVLPPVLANFLVLLRIASSLCIVRLLLSHLVTMLQGIIR